MRNPLSDKVVGIQPSGIRKFFDIVSEMKDAISLGVGEPDFDTPWSIREEGIYSLEKGRTYYTSNAGLSELRTEICNFLNRRYGLNYNPDGETLITVGGSEAIDLAFRSRAMYHICHVRSLQMQHPYWLILRRRMSSGSHLKNFFPRLRRRRRYLYFRFLITLPVQSCRRKNLRR